MSDCERAQYEEQLMSLFTYTQRNKIVHGALHPEFLFVRPNKTIAVAGWDFSQRSLPMINTHRAPEEYRKNGGMNSDFYAVVLLTYELVTKKKPWESKCTAYEVQKRKCESLLRPMTAFGFSEQKSNVFMKALDAKPHKRFKTLEDFRLSFSTGKNVQSTSKPSPKIEQIVVHRKPIMVSRNPQNTSLFVFILILGLFLGLYKPIAQAANTTWKTGYSFGEGEAHVDEERLDIEMITLESNTTHTESKTHQEIKSFSISQTEITQKQWSLVMNSNLSSSKRAKTNISWLDAIRFCNALSFRHSLDPVYVIKKNQIEYISNNNGYRLPTVQEWEYAAIGTGKTLFSGSNNIDKVAWTSRNTKGKIQVTKTKAPNEFGIYDMSGNAAEWIFESESCEHGFCILDDKTIIKGGSVRSLKNANKPNVNTKVDKRKKSIDVGFRIARNEARLTDE
jgi:hypothetical protein